MVQPHFSRTIKHALAGFTLAELLIVLGILAVIATFTIPKILQSQQQQACYANFKETISAMALIVHNAKVDGTLPSTGWGPGLFANNLNYVKYCPNGTGSQSGCWDFPLNGALPHGNPDNDVFVLANGVVVQKDGGGGGGSLCVNASNCFTAWYIDCNGSQGANMIGQDQILIGFCNNDPGMPCNYYSHNYYTPIMPAYVVWTQSTTLYNQIFSN